MNSEASQKSILLIEDDADFRESVCEILEDEGYEVIEAEDGPEGLESFHSQKPDLVVSDISLPAQDGLELLMQLRAENPGLRCVCLSGAVDGNVQWIAPFVAKLGGFKHLEKPFRIHELTGIVEQLLDEDPERFVQKALIAVESQEHSTLISELLKSVGVESAKVSDPEDQLIGEQLFDLVLYEKSDSGTEVYKKCCLSRPEIFGVEIDPERAAPDCDSLSRDQMRKCIEFSECGKRSTIPVVNRELLIEALSSLLDSSGLTSQ